MEQLVLNIIILGILSGLIAKLGEKREIGFEWSFILSIFLSPLVGLIITLFSKKKSKIDLVDMNN